MADSVFTPVTDSPHRRKSSRKSWNDQSPVNPMTDIAREETLLLTHFAKKPTISFGKVKVGKSLDRKLYVKNPHEYDQLVVVEKFPGHMNFAINLYEFVVPGESTLCLYLTWTPENEGGCRQIITFLIDDSYRLQTVLYGTAEVPRKKKVAKRGIMSQSVKTPFAVLHTPNLANLKTYNTSMVQERVLETTHVRRALPISKSNQENRQPSTKKSSLVTVKSPTPIIQNVNYQNQVEEFGVAKRRSADRDTKLKTNLENIQHVYRPSPEQHETGSNYEPVEEPVFIEEYRSVGSTVSEEEHVTKISTVNVWKISEESREIESRDEVTEMQVFDCEFRKRQKQSPEQDVSTLNPRRETYSVKKNMSKQRRNWRNHLSSPSVRAAMPKRVIMPTLKSEEPTKSTLPTPNPSNFITSSPIGNCGLTNNTFKCEDSVKRNGPVLKQTDSSELSNSKDGIEERPVMISKTVKTRVSPKSDDGMSTDSLNSNSKNSSASSVEALLTSEVKKSHEVSAGVLYDFRHATPSLPEKTHPYEVRRSTHVVKEPKFVCGQGKLKQKQLFASDAGSSADPDVSYIKTLDDTKDLPPPKTTQFKTVSTVRNSVSSRVRIAQKAMRMTNREQLSQSVHEHLQNSGKVEILEKSASNITRSARSAVKSVKKTEITKSKTRSYTPKKCGIAQTRLVLGKREKTVVPKHPMPFASKNIYYDDRWMQKQEWSFTHWFNFILTPVEDYKLRNCPKVDAGSLVFNCKRDYHLAPSKEVLSFEAYAARRRLNRLRKLACKMFQSPDVVKVVRKVEVEIDSQRLVVRKDRPIHADIGLKQNILNWILSYNPLWLRIGLEMVFGEVLLIESNTDILGLSKFIITRLVGNPDIEVQYAHPTVPHLYREGYQTALAKHTLKKFLILVYFLDYAKRHRLIEHDPCLLCTDSKLKASRDFLVNISRDFLSGEGDITRHLSYFGYVVSYVQTPLDEFDYAVTNLATDLRDGVRLTRVVEILTGEWGLTKMLRAPAISRLQKIHNIEKVLKALVSHGMSLTFEKTKICAKDIVDGHREKTLALLWRIVTQFQVDILLDVKELEDEIACLDRSLKRKLAIWKAAGVKSDFELKSRRSSVEPTQFENSTHRLLFVWCQAVCAHYGLKMENFTVSFSDGRILCFLIHHYYPGLLPISEIRQQTTVTYMNEWESQQQQDSDNSFDGTASTLSCNPRTGKPLIYQELLANEAENFKLIAVKVSQIGGVPTMLRHLDMSNTIPDAKIVITYVMYLAIRLLEIRHEARAAIIIQLAWRKYQLRKRKRLLKLKSKTQTPIPNYEMIVEENRTPDQSSPLRNKTPTSIKNAVLTFPEHSGDVLLGRSINDYSPIKPIDNDQLLLSAKKGKVLDTILECSTIAGGLSYSNVSHQEHLGHVPVLNEKDISLDVGQKGQTLDGAKNSLQTFNPNSLLPSDFLNISGHKINANETFEGETLFVKSDLPVVDCPRVQNETFEKEIHLEKSAPNLSLSNCEQGSHNATFDREVNSSNEAGLSNSCPTKVDLHGNKTFDRMSRPDLLNALSTIEESLVHEDDEELEDLKSDDVELEKKRQQAMGSLRRNVQEEESYDLGEQGPFTDEQKYWNDGYTSVSHEEKTQQLTLEETAKLSDLSQVRISDEPARTIRLDDYSRQNEIDNESQPTKIDSSSHHVDNKITNLESNDEDEELFTDNESQLYKIHYSRHEDDRITNLESNNEDEDLFNDSYICQVQNDSVSFSRLNKTTEVDKSLQSGSTPSMIQSSAIDDHIRNGLDISYPVDSLQDRLTGTDEEDNHDKAVLSDSQLDRSVLEDEGNEEWTEEFVLKMSRSRKKEMIVDNEGQVENESDDDHVRIGLDVFCPADLSQESFTSVDGERNCDKAMFPNSQQPRSVSDANEESSKEFVLKMSDSGEIEMIIDNENQSQSESTDNCQMNTTVSDDGSVANDSTSAMHRDSEDGGGHVRICLDEPSPANLLQESYTSVDGESNQDKTELSNSQLQRSVLDENEECTEEFVLKMSRSHKKEMIVDKEGQAENVSVIFSQLAGTAEGDRSLNNDSTSVRHHDPEDDDHVRNGLDISCPVKSFQDSFTGTDGEDNYDKAILSDDQLDRSVLEDEGNEEWTEEFVLKMSRSRKKEMIVDREEQVENEPVSFSRQSETVENDESFSNGGSTTTMHQDFEYGSGVRNGSDISCPSDAVQDSFNGTDGETNCEQAVLSDSQLQRSVREDETEESTEEFVLKMSCSRQREMTVDNEAEIENDSLSFFQQSKNVGDMSSHNNSTSATLQSPGDCSYLRNGLDASYTSDSLQDSFTDGDGKNNCDNASLSDTQQQSDIQEDEELTAESLLKMSCANQKEIIIDNENQSQNDSTNSCKMDKTEEGDRSLNSDSTSATHQNLGDDYHDGKSLDISCPVNSLQDGVTDTDKESDRDMATLSDSQLNRSEFKDENDESTGSGNRNGLDISCPSNSLQDSFNGTDGEANYEKAILSASQLQQSDFEDENDESTEEFILKMSHSPQREMTVDNGAEVENESLNFSQQDRTGEDMSLHDISTSANPGEDMSLHDISTSANPGEDMSLHDISTSANPGEDMSLHDISTSANPGDCCNLSSSLDVSSPTNSLQDGFTDVDGENNCDKAILYDSQLQRSDFAENEEWSEEELVLKMSRACPREMIVDKDSLDSSEGQETDFADKSAEVIQNAFRGFKARQRFLQFRNSAIAVQRWYRRTKEMRKSREYYRSLKAATIVIQASVRTSQERKRFLQRRKCVVYLQQRRRALVSMRKARSEYLGKVAAVKAIQRWYRSIAEMRSVKEDFERTRDAVVKIQSLVRMCIFRRRFLQKKEAAVAFQMQKKKCVITMQQRRRALVAMRKARSEYLGKVAAVKAIQRWYRSIAEMRSVKEDFERTRDAVVKIQSLVRMWICRKKFSQNKEAAVAIQIWYRSIQLMKTEKMHYASVKKATIRIQAMFRRYNQRKLFLLEKKSAVLIQKTFRMFINRKHYHAYKNSAIDIQQWYRRTKKAKEARQHYQELKKATLVIQSTVRCYLARKRFLNEKRCLVLLQRRRRCLMLMRTARTEYLAKRAATKTIQRWYRAVTVMRKAENDFQNTRMAIIKIQSLVRQRSIRKEFLCRKNSVLTLQKWFRAVLLMKIERRRYKSLKNAAVQIQAIFRGQRQRKSYLLKRESALKIQSMFRMYQTRKSYLCRRNSAITIQQWYRNAVNTKNAHRNFLNLRAATLVIQSNIKAYQERRRFLLKRRCVVFLQHRRRGLLAMRIKRSEYLSKKQSAIVIQRWYRSMKQMTNEMTLYRSKKMATIKIQSAFRSHVQRKIYLEKRKQVITVQSVVRRWIARRNWLATRSAAVMIQRNYRRHLARRRLRETIARRCEAAACIQSWFRMKLLLWSRKGLPKIECDCCSSTSLMKTKKFSNIWLERTRRRKVNAVCVLQKYCREWLQRRNHAATTIQTIARGWLVRRRLAKQKTAAILIQKTLRGWHARMTFRKRKRATCLLQPVIRGWLVRNQVKKWNHSATRIQSFWRGYKVRCSTKGNVTNVRKRLLDSMKKVTHDKKLSSRFSVAFDYLMKYKQLSELLQALVNLEVSSRLSPVCCAQLADGHAAPVIFTIIRSCNRSIPHMELIKNSIQILLNLAKYAPTIEAVYDSQPDAIDIILNVMMVFREKGLIFSKSCILLAIIALDMKEKGEIDRLWSKPKFKEQIMSLYKLTERKYKREESRVTTRARMVAAKDSAIFYKFSNATAAQSRIGPDWLLGKKILRAVDEPLQAMTYLLNCLNLRPETQQTSCKKTRSSK